VLFAGSYAAVAVLRGPRVLAARRSETSSMFAASCSSRRTRDERDHAELAQKRFLDAAGFSAVRWDSADK